jgi:hypothetical protein
MFDAMRGMDYMLDLLYRRDGVDHEPRAVRVHVTRPVAHTQLMSQVLLIHSHLILKWNEVHLQVPYVKEDTDVTVVVPVGRSDDVAATRRFIARFVRLCQTESGDRRNTRLVLAVSL